MMICACLRQGNNATVNFHLNNFTDLSALQNAIRNIPYLGGTTNTTGGLRLMRKECFNGTNGDRYYASNVAILITDGNPNRELHLLPGEVATIRSLNIRVIAVAVTNAVTVAVSRSGPFQTV